MVTAVVSHFHFTTSFFWTLQGFLVEPHFQLLQLFREILILVVWNRPSCHFPFFTSSSLHICPTTKHSRMPNVFTSHVSRSCTIISIPLPVITSTREVISYIVCIQFGWWWHWCPTPILVFIVRIRHWCGSSSRRPFLFIAQVCCKKLGWYGHLNLKQWWDLLCTWPPCSFVTSILFI